MTILSRHDQVQDFGWIKPGPSPNFEAVGGDVAERAAQRIDEVLAQGVRDRWQEAMAGMLDDLL